MVSKTIRYFAVSHYGSSTESGFEVPIYEVVFVRPSIAVAHCWEKKYENCINLNARCCAGSRS